MYRVDSGTARISVVIRVGEDRPMQSDSAPEHAPSRRLGLTASTEKETGG